MNKLLFELAALLQISHLLFSSLQIIGLVACNLFFQISVTLLIFGRLALPGCTSFPSKAEPNACFELLLYLFYLFVQLSNSTLVHY